MYGSIYGAKWLCIYGTILSLPMKSDTETRHKPVERVRQSSKLVWVVSVATVLFLSRVLLVNQDYTLCSPTNLIYTVDESLPQAQCISVRDGRVAAVGHEG